MTEASSSDTPRAFQGGYESAGFDVVPLLVGALVDVVKLTGLWRIGDGFGGWLHEIIDDAAEERGLQTKRRRKRV